MARMRYDATVDALGIELTEGAKSAKTVRAGQGINLDYDKKGRLIAIEILDASFHMSKADLAALPTGAELLMLAEASRESGLSPSTLRVQLNAGRLKGIKRGRDWHVDATELWNYLESRAPQGRRSPREVRPPAPKPPTRRRRSVRAP